MNPTELERLVKKITDCLEARLGLDKQLIEVIGKYDSYPAWFKNRILTDFNCQFNSKQDGENTILLCLSDLELPELIAVSKLISINERTKRIVKFLCYGKNVWIIQKDTKFLEFKQKQRYAVRKEVLTAMDKTKAMGVKFIANDRILKEELHDLKANKSHKPKIYITLNDVIDRKSNNQPLLRENEHPTDLAMDWIHENGDDKHEY